MHTPLQTELLDETVRLIALLRPLVEGVRRKDRDLAAQLQRAATSVALNLAESFGNSGGHSRLRFQTALGSHRETCAGLRVAAAWGHVKEADVGALLVALDRLGGRLYGLCRH